MPMLLLPPGVKEVLNFTGSPRGYADISVEANDLITVVVTSEEGVQQFNAGLVGLRFGYAQGVTTFRKRVRITRSAPFALILVNYADDRDRWDDARAVSYAVVQGR